MSTAVVEKTNIAATHRRVAIQADAGGVLPDRIELVKAGTWPDDSNKGYLEITRGDLLEMKANFDAGVSMPKGLNKIAVDFMHQDYDKAALWIAGMEVDGDTLIGTQLEYSTSGRAAILGGEFKCLSPSFYPRCRGQWHDSEDWSITAENVIVGAALTNIPFFKSLKPITASNSQEGEETTLFVDASSERSNMPTLDEVRAKDKDALTTEDSNLLVEANREGKLTADEQTKFGFEAVAPVDANNKEKGTQMTDEQKKDAQVLADIRDGRKVVVDASEHQSLKASVEALQASELANRKEKVEASVKAAAAAGKIKNDQIEAWTTRIMADASLEDLMTNLDANKLLAADENGGDGGNANLTANAELQEKGAKLVADNKDLKLADAYKQVIASDEDLAARFDAERKVTN